MHFLRSKIEIFALDVFLCIHLNCNVCHVAPLIEGNLNFFITNILLPFLRYQCLTIAYRNAGFSALVQQEMGKGVDIDIYQGPLCALILKYA